MRRIQELLSLTRKLLSIPSDFKIALTPGSDTGAVEMALWSLLGQRPVDVISFDRFGELWVHDILRELSLKSAKVLSADFGDLPNLKDTHPDHDIVFCWNGTTSGVCVPDGAWIDPDRSGLTICDATSAVFAYDMPWPLLDVTCFSWQKALGGEAGTGVIILSPRAVERLRTYSPPWPMPRLFRMTHDRQVNEQFFLGHSINTVSLLCIEDCLDALRWVESQGGLPFMIERSKQSLKTIGQWVEKTPWIDFMAEDPALRSRTSICLKPVEPGYREIDDRAALQIVHEISDLLHEEKAAFDIRGHKEAPACLRIWGGGMVDPKDIEFLLPWLDWAYQQVQDKVYRRKAG